MPKIFNDNAWHGFWLKFDSPPSTVLYHNTNAQEKNLSTRHAIDFPQIQCFPSIFYSTAIKQEPIYIQNMQGLLYEKD